MCLIDQVDLTFAQRRIAIIAHGQGGKGFLVQLAVEESIGRRIYEKYPQLEGDLRGKIVLLMLLRGGFHIFRRYGEKYNADDLLKTIGDINECLVENFIKV